MSNIIYIAGYTYNYSDDYRPFVMKVASFDYEKVYQYCKEKNEERIKNGDLNGNYEIEEIEII